MQDKIKNLAKEAKDLLTQARDLPGLYQVKVTYMGKKGKLSSLMKGLKDVDPKDRPVLGQIINQTQKEFDELYKNKENALKNQSIQKTIESTNVDLSLPGLKNATGSLHPITLVNRKILKIFKKLGWSVQTGPFIESDWYNFTALNIPPFHPSRDLQDTFYLKENFVLRTHTSPVQIRSMEKLDPPLAILAPGAVFRSDSDVSHSPMFHQVEGLFIDKKVSFSQLKGVLNFFLEEFFQNKLEIRLRPSYFPFTEPSAEYDISCFFCKSRGCSICKHAGWIEIGGCGLVHPNVFENVGLGNKWQGYAFGLGVERLAMLMYNIPDIRLFFENDLRFLKQF